MNTDDAAEPVTETLVDVDITEEAVSKAIDAQSAASAGGPDGFPALVLKKCKASLIPHLTSLFKMSLENGDVPKAFRCAIIKPLLKSGKNKASKSRYRPIALTSVICKAMERVLRSSIQKFLEDNQLLSPNQHGFRTGRSCLSQLLAHYDDTISALEKESNMDIVYLDYAKAFDKVDVAILATRLKEKGISGKLGRWIFNWLSERSQSVSANSELSAEAKVTSGVPQGSVLGPILFLVMIDTIDDCGIKAWIRIFADDTRLGTAVNDINDAENLQDDLERIYEWQRTSNMLFNTDKFEVLQIGVKEDLKSSYNYLTPNSESAIERKEKVKDLGVWMKDKADFSDHIAAVIARVRKLMGWLRRNFITRDPEFQKVLWRTYLQPHLDYASQLWSPSTSKELQNLEDYLGASPIDSMELISSTTGSVSRCSS